jgi:hypothetical protein
MHIDDWSEAVFEYIRGLEQTAWITEIVRGGLRLLALREFRQSADWHLNQNNGVIDHMADNRRRSLPSSCREEVRWRYLAMQPEATIARDDKLQTTLHSQGPRDPPRLRSNARKKQASKQVFFRKWSESTAISAQEIFK